MINSVVSSGEELGELAVELLHRTDAGRKPVRLLGVGLSSLQSSELPQIEQLKLPLPDTGNSLK